MPIAGASNLGEGLDPDRGKALRMQASPPTPAPPGPTAAPSAPAAPAPSAPAAPAPPADPAAATPAPAAAPAPAPAAPAPAAQRPAKRAVPDYDGRGDAPTTAGDVFRGIGRVLLFIPRVVVDYGVRWPVGYVVRNVEHSRGARAAFRYVFLQPPAPTMAIFPIAFYDFGFQSSVGVRMVWTNGFLTPGSKVSIKLGTGGRDWWRADTNITVAAPYGLRPGIDFAIRNRPDQQFFGLGPRTPQSALARYAHSRASVGVHVGWPQLQLFVASVTSAASTSHFSDDASIEDQVAAGRIAELPAGYHEILATRRVGARLALDTRWNRPSDGPPASGARLDATLERVRDGERGSWTHLDATLGGALVLDAIGEHKLDLRARVELVSSAAGVTVPFLELPSIGGSRDLRGFGSGRGRDLSAAALTLDYQWPLAAWLDATIYLGVGNVFGENLSGLYAGALRASAGFGLGLAGLDDERQIELWAATGTDPLDEGLDATVFRLVLGYTHDY